MNDRVSLDPLPYYKWHWLRWRASRKVQRMSLLERGIYRELLDEQWAQGCIRDDTATLSEILDDSQQMLALAKQVLSKCFTEISPGVWQNSTLEEQRTETDKIRSNRKIAGTLGALSKSKPIASAKQVLASAGKCHIEREREEREEKRRGEEREENPAPPKTGLDSGSELMLAAWVFEEANVPCDNSMVRVAGDCIRKLAREAGMDYKGAADVILGAARAAIDSGEPITRFWLTDQRYKPQRAKKSERQKRIEEWEPSND